MKKYIYLSTCDTCKRIMKDTGISNSDFELYNLKDSPISESDLELAYAKTQSYEALFNKRARKYSLEGLKEKQLSETDFRNLILNEYTFLKRPVTFINDDVFVGNSKKEVERLKKRLEHEK